MLNATTRAGDASPLAAFASTAIVLAAGALGAMSGRAQAQWTCDDPLASRLVADDPWSLPPYAIQAPRGIVADGLGGVFIAWSEYSGQLEDRVRLQHLDGEANRLWGDEGMIAMDEPFTEGPVSLLPDGSGGTILLHYGPDAHIRAHRFDASGARLWGARGVKVLPKNCPDAETSGAMVFPDHEGGFYYLWRRSLWTQDLPDELRVQHFGADGAPMWGEDPCGIVGATSDFLLDTYGGLVDPDGSGGLFISMTTNMVNVRAQRLDGTGARLWGERGVLVSYQGPDQWVKNPHPDGAGGIVLLWHKRDPDAVWGARLTGTGQNLWTPNGEHVYEGFPGGTMADGEGGAWFVLRRFDDIYLQRVTNENTIVFEEDIVISAAPDRQNIPRMRPGPGGNVFLVWTDWRNEGSYGNQDIYFQQVTSEGELVEPLHGSPVTTAPGQQGEPEMQADPDQRGNLFVAWTNVHGYVRDVYAERATCATCDADFNGDGLVNTQDVLAFLNAWVAGDGRADFNGDGAINTQDVLVFLNAWTAGCP